MKMHWGVGICTVLLSLLSPSPAFFLSPKGEIRPMNPYAAANESLEVNCTVLEPDTCSGVNSVYFQWGGWRINDTYTRVVDATTKHLSLPNPPMSKSGVHFYCYCLKNGEKKLLNSQTVRVYRYPIKPVIKGCKVFNWKRMECWWEPSDKIQNNYTGLNVEQTMYWTLLPAYESRYQCPHQRGTVCEWLYVDNDNPADSLRVNDNYTIGVHVGNNDIGKVSADEQLFQTVYLVEPDPVQKMRVYNRTSRSIKLAWDPPVDNKVSLVILYSIKYRCVEKWCTADEEMEKNMTGKFEQPLNIALDGLRPYHNYEISIRCIPFINGRAQGFWSMPQVKVEQTEPDVPGANPVASPGSFEINHHSSVFTLYWQRIHEKQKHSAEIEYILRRKCEGQTETTLNILPEDTNRYHSEWQQEVVCNYTVISRTKGQEQGYNDNLPSYSIVVPPTSAQSYAVARTVPIVKGNVRIRVLWERVVNASSYTVYWCEGSLRSPCSSKDGELNFMTKAPEQGLDWLYVELALDKPYTWYNFGVSVEKVDHKGQTLSAGLKWNDCSYKEEEEPAKPVGFKLSENQVGESLKVEWQPPKCGAGGFISHYQIQYWAVDKPSHKHAEDVSWNRISHRIDDLEPFKKYAVQMASVGFPENRFSGFTEPEEIYIEKIGLTGGEIVGIVIGCMVALGLICIGVYSCVKWGKKRYKKYTDLTIALPDRVPDEEIGQHKDDYHGTNTPYRRMPSNISGDSGVEIESMSDVFANNNGNGNDGTSRQSTSSSKESSRTLDPLQEEVDDYTIVSKPQTSSEDMSAGHDNVDSPGAAGISSTSAKGLISSGKHDPYDSSRGSSIATYSKAADAATGSGDALGSNKQLDESFDSNTTYQVAEIKAANLKAPSTRDTEDTSGSEDTDDHSSPFAPCINLEDVNMSPGTNNLENVDKSTDQRSPLSSQSSQCSIDEPEAHLLRNKRDDGHDKDSYDDLTSVAVDGKQPEESPSKDKQNARLVIVPDRDTMRNGYVGHAAVTSRA